MPADRSDLARRLAECRASDTSRGLNFNRLFDAVREHVGDEAARACDPQGKGSRIDVFSYPAAEYVQVAWNAADRIEPVVGSLDAAWEDLGRRTVTGFLASALGRTIFALAGRDPRRFLAAGPPGYRAAASYGERTVEWKGEKAARLVFRRDFLPPEFHRAVIAAGLEASDARRPKVVARATGLLDSEYDVTWE
jgi:uncharacterized protein (TIGR02265 family)